MRRVRLCCGLFRLIGVTSFDKVAAPERPGHGDHGAERPDRDHLSTSNVPLNNGSFNRYAMANPDGGSAHPVVTSNGRE